MQSLHPSNTVEHATQAKDIATVVVPTQEVHCEAELKQVMQGLTHG